MKQKVYMLIPKGNKDLYKELNNQEFVTNDIFDFILKKEKEYKTNIFAYYDTKDSLFDAINNEIINFSIYNIATVYFDIISSLRVYNVVSMHTCVEDSQIVHIVGSYTDFNDAMKALEKDYSAALDSMINAYGDENVEISDNCDYRIIYGNDDRETYSIEIQETFLNDNEEED